MHKTLVTVMVSLFMLWGTGAWAELKDGLWEFTSQTEIAGMQHQVPPNTFRQCITKGDPVLKNQDKNYNCKTTSMKISGNTVNYSVTCSGKDGEMQMTGTSTYTGNTMQGSSTTNFKMAGQPAMQMKSKTSGKYIGPCPK